MEVEGYKKKVDEMEGVATLQKEVADLDRCLAWSEALDLRVEVQQLTAAIEEQLPKEVDEVRAASEGLLSDDARHSHHCIRKDLKGILMQSTHMALHDHSASCLQLKHQLDAKAEEVAEAGMEFAQKVSCTGLCYLIVICLLLLSHYWIIYPVCTYEFKAANAARGEDMRCQCGKSSQGGAQKA